MKAKNVFSLWLVVALCLLPGQAAAVSLDAGTFYIDYIKPRPSGLSYVNITGYYNMTEVDTEINMCMANITAVNSSIADHVENTSNPHGVTASQLTITDGDVPDNITIDNATNANMVGGYHAGNAANQIPILDSGAKLPTAQMPYMSSGFNEEPGGYYVDNTGIDIFHANEPQVMSGSGVYVKLKQVNLTKVPDSSLKIYFEFCSFESASVTVYAQIYKNGVAVGTEQNTTSVSYVSFTEVITEWNDGDTLELWGRTTNSPLYDVAVQKLRVLGSITPATGMTNTDP